MIKWNLIDVSRSFPKIVLTIEFYIICINGPFGWYGFLQLFDDEIQYVFGFFPSYSIFYFLLKLYYFIFWLSACFVIGFKAMEFILNRTWLRNSTINQRPSAQVIRLPKVKKHLLKNMKIVEGDIDQPECAICLDNFNAGEKINELKCNTIHVFHHDCMLEWVKTNDICPMCR
jgi:hypothetical protein